MKLVSRHSWAQASASATAVIRVPARRVYDILADYRQRFLTTSLLRRIYSKQLARLEAYGATQR